VALDFLKRVARFAQGDGGSIKTRLLRSGFWVGISQVFVTVLNLGRSVVLARLLTPEIFGLMALAMVVVRAIESFTRPGISQALIARREEFHTAAGTAFSMLVARGVLLSVLICAAAPFIARFYESDELAPMLMVMSAVFLIGSLGNINLIARQKELDFRSQTLLQQATNICGTIVTICLAWWLRSVWALVIGQVVQVSLNTLLSYYFFKERTGFAFDRAVARDLFSYGKFITGSSLITYIAAELDSAVIGKLLGASELGYYTLAATIGSLVTLNITRMAASLVMPAYSKLQTDPAAVRAMYLRVLSLVMLVVMPASIGLIVTADPLIHVVYGEKWLPAVVPLQMIAVFGIFRCLLSFSGYMFEGIGQPKVAFQLGFLRLVAVASLIVPLINEWGILGAAVTVTIGGIVQSMTGLVFLRRFVAISAGDVFGVMWRPLWTSLLMAVAVVLLLHYVVDGRTILGLLAAVLVGGGVFGALNVRTVRDAIATLKGRKKGAAA
jgi:O-antigen/teichoic acid export membrane protein